VEYARELGAGEDRARVDAFLEERSAVHVARLGELVDARDHPALVAEEQGRLVGVLTYVIDGDRCEVLTLHAAEQRRGIGRALMQKVQRIGGAAGCNALWLITTNDNLDALRFYQQRGFRLAKLHAGAVDESRRTLKPEIPVKGEYGIFIHDELELIKEL
jgi:ribosomal protein S18 acetylase RimI-like enzyme